MVDEVLNSEVKLVLFMDYIRIGFDYIMLVKYFRIYINDILWIIEYFKNFIKFC